MRNFNFRRLATLIAAIVVVFTATTTAHDFWIEPSSFAPRADEAVRIQLRVGEHFLGEAVPRNSAAIEKFVAVGPSGERPIAGRDGMDPAGVLRLDAPGMWHIAYRSKSAPVTLPAEQFEQYLREEGLEYIIDARAARGQTRAPGRERFSRSVKSLLRSGTAAPATGFDRALGLTLEFVLDADPDAAPRQRVPMRLLLEGRPLAKALVVAYRRNAGAIGAGTEAMRARTDDRGRIVVNVEPGQWLVKAVYMQGAPLDSGVDWESVWTALTFEVRDR
jgi:Domain of unknown function (DUF4198)